MWRNFSFDVNKHCSATRWTTLYRPDGQHAVAIMYLEGEVMTAADDGDPQTKNEKANQRWFLLNYYPIFGQAARAAGIIPSIYFLTAGTEDNMLDNDFQDSYLPELSGHRSVYWIYRVVHLVAEHWGSIHMAKISARESS